MGNFSWRGDSPTLKGSLILWRVGSVEEARGIAEKDPYVIAGLLTYDLREWPAGFDYTKTPSIVS